MEGDNISLSALLKLVNNSEQSISSSLIDTHEQFLDYVYKTLDRIISKIQKKRSLYHKMSEPQIAGFINMMLTENNLLADSKEINGNTDITVEIAGNDFLWICEAKYDNSTDYVFEGYLQLSTRYATFEKNEREGGVLVFNRTYPIGDFIKKLQKELPVLAKAHELEIISCEKRPDFSFFSESKIPSLGSYIKYRARFMCINLLHLPEDKSAKKAKIHKRNREDVANRRLGEFSD